MHMPTDGHGTKQLWNRIKIKTRGVGSGKPENTNHWMSESLEKKLWFIYYLFKYPLGETAVRCTELFSVLSVLQLFILNSQI